MSDTNYEIRNIDSNTEADRLLNKYFVPNPSSAYVEIGNDNFCMPITFQNVAECITNFEVRNDDVYVMGFPRSGTTWCEEMVWLIVNNFNFIGAQEMLSKRVPVLELDAYSEPNNVDSFNYCMFGSTSLKYINACQSPRVIKSHLHFDLLPKDIIMGTKRPKIIYMLRNPKDVCVSYFHVSKYFSDYKGTFEEFCITFLGGRITGAPFWKTVLSFWKEKHRSNILFISYKDMITDLPSVIRTVTTFLGKGINELQMEQLIEHLNIENMRKNRAVNMDEMFEKFLKPHSNAKVVKNNFIRNGKLCGYKEDMPPEIILKFDVWTKENLEGIDLGID